MSTTEKRYKRNDRMISIVGANIRKYRKLKGLTQAELAYSCDITPGMISDYERGKVDTNITTLCLIADQLGIKPGKLFDETSEIK